MAWVTLEETVHGLGFSACTPHGMDQAKSTNQMALPSLELIIYVTKAKNVKGRLVMP